MAEVLSHQRQGVLRLSVVGMCRAVGLSRATCYRLRRSRPQETPSLALRDRLQRSALQWPTYGYRRLTHALRRGGVRVNHKHVRRLMREDNLLCLRRRRVLRTTDSQHGLAVYPNLVPHLAVTGLDQLWVADITYIRLQQEFVYLAVLLDACSRRCIGWALERSLETPLLSGPCAWRSPAARSDLAWSITPTKGCRTPRPSTPRCCSPAASGSV